jgi:hypothetical protein
MEFIIGSILWFAAGILLPMAALEPVQAGPGAASVTSALLR